MVLFGKTYTIKRMSAEGYYDDSGKYIAGYESEEEITADCQPLSNKEIESLNIGRDDLGKIKIYTDEDLNIATVGDLGGDLQNGDMVVFDGNDYEVIARSKHEVGLIPHKKYIAELRIDNN